MRPTVLCSAFLALLPCPAQSPFKDLWVRMVNPEVEVQLRHPPGLGLQLRRVAFLPAPDEPSVDLAVACIEDLGSQGELEVVDRAHLEAILKEQGLGAAHLLDPGTLARVGKLLGAQALVALNVGHYRPEETRTRKDNSYTDKDGKLHKLVHYLARTTVEMAAGVQVTDLMTGRIFGTQRFTASPYLEESSDYGYPDYPSELKVREVALAQVRTEIRRLLLPWTEPRKLVFFDDRDYDLREAHQALKAGDSAQALVRAEESLGKVRADPRAKSKYVGRANYNLGMCHFILGRPEEALTHLRAAREADEESTVFKEGVEECQRALQLQEERRRTEERTTRRSEEETAPSTEERLRRLNDLWKKGLISEEEFLKKKAEILKGL